MTMHNREQKVVQPQAPSTGSRSFSIVSEARGSRRVPIERIPMQILSEAGQSVGHLRNVSKQGVFVRTSEMPPPGNVVAIQFSNPNGGFVNLQGEVRWTTKQLENPEVPEGFGVRLDETPGEFRRFFMWALSQSEADDADARV